MAKHKKTTLSKKKELRKAVMATLETAFISLKDSLGEKKFERHVKKASKILIAGAAKNMGKIAKSQHAA